MDQPTIVFFNFVVDFEVRFGWEQTVDSGPVKVVRRFQIMQPMGCPLARPIQRWQMTPVTRSRATRPVCQRQIGFVIPLSRAVKFLACVRYHQMREQVRKDNTTQEVEKANRECMGHHPMREQPRVDSAGGHF